MGGARQPIVCGDSEKHGPPVSNVCLAGIEITATKILPKLSVKINIKNKQLVEKLNKIDVSKTGGRVKYYRMFNKMSVPELARLTGVSRDNILQYEECANFCPVDFCVKVAEIFNIELSLLCDDFLLFMTTDYVGKINNAKEKLGISYFELARIYRIPHNILLSWVRGEYTPCRSSYDKYVKGNPLFGELE